ncbi:hypothetical protein BDQ12DRAFT_137888 [Crucibulum laeve]|uniref:F-box domain-containing protein n=1 Tax=Crucibulum laeve TaxID=68775 RepID=A0A5C3LWU9_9AGAR|nr:hypothetical protein BDQ12DRAFT_137888 [Crucibulum laeve]
MTTVSLTSDYTLATHDTSSKMTFQDLTSGLKNLSSENTSSIHSLPVEVLSLIFNTAYISVQSNFDKDQQLALAVSQVSQHWRNIALHTPSLWSNILLRTAWNYELTEMCLFRSSLHPIYLCIFSDKEEYPSCGIELDFLQELIVPHLPRCRSIKFVSNYIRTDHSILRTLFLNSGSIFYPFLEDFYIECNVRHLQPHVERSVSPGNNAPKLRHFYLDGERLLPYTPPLKNVTTLHLANMKDILDVIRHCPLLETLWICDAYTGWVDDRDPYEHSSLRSLHIFGSDCVSKFLLYLVAPKLEDLVIPSVSFRDLTVLHSCTDVGSPRFPSLKSLALPLTVRDFSAALALAAHCFPTIETLILPYLRPRDFIEGFSQSIERTVFARLTSLAIREVDTKGEAAISELVLRRKLQGCPLRMIFVDGSSYQNSLLANLGTEVEIKEKDLWGDIWQAAGYMI